ncbi:MAG: hypothetical protein HC796_01885 [Synechococcaceae cyanobacterium RL_1_2]|nr:hypothetical protein [Synechococcaceae cyanobacterium RL_1_2]
MVGVVAYLGYRSGEEAIAETVEQLLTEMGQRVTHHLDDYLQGAEKVNHANKEAIEAKLIDPNERLNLGKFLLQQVQNYGFTYSRYGDRDGHTIGAGYGVKGLEIKQQIDPLQPNRIRRYRVTPLGDILDSQTSSQGSFVYDSWYPMGLPTKTGGWSPIHNWNSSPQTIVMSHRIPIHDRQKQTIGTLDIDLSLDNINSFLTEIQVGKTGNIFIVDRHGLLVANSTSELSYRMVGDQAQRIRTRDLTNPLIQSTLDLLRTELGDFPQALQGVSAKPGQERESILLKMPICLRR